MKHSCISLPSHLSLVAPVRERGLKQLLIRSVDIYTMCRSREGAWIETFLHQPPEPSQPGRSREGAWIETELPLPNGNLNLGRSREGAWIET